MLSVVLTKIREVSEAMAVMGPDPAKVGRIAYYNQATSPVTISIFQPGSSTPAGTFTVPPGANNYLGSSAAIGNTWGVLVGTGAQRVVGNVCSWVTTPAGNVSVYWQCIGSDGRPFPR